MQAVDLIEIVFFFIGSVIRFIYRAFSSNILLNMGVVSFMICFMGVIAGPIYLAITRQMSIMKKAIRQL